MIEQDKKQAIKQIKSLITSNEFVKAFAALRHVADPEDDFILQSAYARLSARIPKGFLGHVPVRIAVVSSSTTSHFVEILRFWLAVAGMAAEIYEADFNTIYQVILDSSSKLYSFNPDITLIFSNYRDVRCEVVAGSPMKEVDKAINDAVRDISVLWETLRRQCGSHVLQNNADIAPARVFGNHEGQVPWGKTNLLHRFNLALAQAAGPGVTIFDLDHVSSLYGKRAWHDERHWHDSRHAFALDANGLVAHQMAMVIAAVKGLAKKCLVLDLDNTLWGGVVADAGVEGIALGSGVNGEAFVEFQEYILSLKARGIVLAVCSSNNEETAKLPFLHHPDMRIELDDIAVFKANWHNKADNIHEIAATLNLAPDACVFVDDDPAVRDLVRQLVPGIVVPEMGTDPTKYTATLDKQSNFETISFSQEDASRSNYYRDNANRIKYRAQFNDLSEYLQSLEMTATVCEFDRFNLSRIVQLINKSNQFHLTTTRYTEAQIRAMLDDPNKYCRCFTLDDKFSSNGLISVVILEKQQSDSLLIDTWVMSCRVLARGTEQFICQKIVSVAAQLGCKAIIGKYLPTAKNKAVANLYEKLQFELMDETHAVTIWKLDLQKGSPVYESFIREVEANVTV